jgi:hypothetical protein
MAMKEDYKIMNWRMKNKWIRQVPALDKTNRQSTVLSAQQLVTSSHENQFEQLKTVPGPQADWYQHSSVLGKFFVIN